MSSYSKLPLSGSVHGRGIKVVNTVVGSADTIHAAAAASADGLGDLITLFAINNHTGNVQLTLCWGGVTDPDDLIPMTLSAKSGLALVTADMILRNSLVVKAFADVANKISIHGYVNRIS